ncbi:cell division ATP-binding protein FtsE [Alkalibacterium sp. MB6]|uniref:cell division ATP-binding protein FtsE n=1 Tax=Alkalibacterium sp. MB6 TaxID=2081965 RepID=UPI00137A8976|nr:cell division ATP-binding protein FtsE [Alkalibacterium sp. MB6]
MIRLKQVSKTYKNKVTALTDISLTIDQGEFVYLVGQSGSGKSSLMKLLYGKEYPTQGYVVVGSRVVNQIKANHLHLLRREVGIVFQEFHLLPQKTVYENVAYVLEVTGHSTASIEEKVMDALTTVGLKHKALDFPSQCSGGEQQRVAIARAIVHRPGILIADEPTGNLDPKTGYDMLKLLHKINKTGTTVIMATHDYSFVERMPSRVIELNKGKIKSDRSKNHTLLLYSMKTGDYFVV